MHATLLPLAPARRTSAYRLRLADTPADLRAAQALRFAVFNLELHEGLAQSWATGRDADRFDAVCDHLIVEEAGSGQVVGTYRLQTGASAARHHGYYSEREFQFAPFESERTRIVELGRACIHAQHRNFQVLNLLWGGIADYARSHGARWLIGCSSLTAQDPRVGAAAWQRLQAHWAAPAWRTEPTAAFACALDALAEEPPRLPKLLSAYLGLGAAVCGPPALDREFGTIDFLTLLDLDGLRNRWLGRATDVLHPPPRGDRR